MNKKTKDKKKRTSLSGNNACILSKNQILWGLGIALVLLISLVAYQRYSPYIHSYILMLKAKYGTVNFPDGNVRGIDVSRYQEEIQWDSLAVANIQGANVSFVFIKATEGVDLEDKYFKYNFYQSRMNGIIRGAYHFYSSLSSAKEQAEFFCRTVQLEDGDLPPVLDVETKGSLTKEELQKELIIWLQSVEDYYDITPIIYTSHSFYKENLDIPFFDSYPHWIAHYYIDSLKFEGDWWFWQHTDYGKVNGIKGYVDINLFNGTYEDLLNITIKSQQ